jgi:hypothetical protein
MYILCTVAVERIEGVKIQWGGGQLPGQSSRLILEVVITVDQYSCGRIRYDLRLHKAAFKESKANGR